MALPTRLSGMAGRLSPKGSGMRAALYGVHFGYGSNMSRRQMLERCPDAVEIGVFRLAGFRLEFFGTADLELDPLGAVWVVAWKLTERDEGKLDRHEGLYFPVPSYQKYAVSAESPGKDVVAGFVYLMTPRRRPRDPRTPEPQYYNTIIAGYEEHNLDTADVIAAFDRAAVSRI